MKAAVYYETGAPEVLRYEDVPDPVASPGSVLIEIGAISIEGGDTLNRAGGEMATNPHIVGYQCAGTIIEVGEGVTDRFVGQRVVATGLWGSHAAMIAAPSVITWVIPEGADLVKCACVPVAFGTADDCLFEFGHLQSGETVLIQAGAGGVGVAAIQLAKRAGRDRDRDRVESRAPRTAEGARPRPRGRLLAVGLGRRGARPHRRPGRRPRRRLGRREGARRQRAVPGVPGPRDHGRQRGPRSAAVRHLGAGHEQPVDHRRVPRRRDPQPRTYAMIAGLVDDVAAGRLEVLVDRLFPLREAADAHAYIESRQAVGRVVLVP